VKRDELAGHFIGVLLVLAMLSCAAAFETPGASEAEPSAFEANVALATPEASAPDAWGFHPNVAFSP
jgi:hypothetical protein